MRKCIILFFMLVALMALSSFGGFNNNKYVRAKIERTEGLSQGHSDKLETMEYLKVSKVETRPSQEDIIERSSWLAKIGYAVVSTLKAIFQWFLQLISSVLLQF